MLLQQRSSKVMAQKVYGFLFLGMIITGGLLFLALCAVILMVQGMGLQSDFSSHDDKSLSSDLDGLLFLHSFEPEKVLFARGDAELLKENFTKAQSYYFHALPLTSFAVSCPVRNNLMLVDELLGDQAMKAHNFELAQKNFLEATDLIHSAPKKCPLLHNKVPPLKDPNVRDRIEKKRIDSSSQNVGGGSSSQKRQGQGKPGKGGGNSSQAPHPRHGQNSQGNTGSSKNSGKDNHPNGHPPQKPPSDTHIQIPEPAEVGDSDPSAPDNPFNPIPGANSQPEPQGSTQDDKLGQVGMGRGTPPGYSS